MSTCTPATLHVALADAPARSVLVLARGVYEIAEPLVVRKALTLVGTPGETHLVSDGRRPILQIAATRDVVLALRGLDFWEGGSLQGAAILSRAGATLLVDRCRFVQNRADAGGALALFGCAATIQRSVFEGNVAVAGGGAVHVGEDADLTLDGCHFHANRAEVGGAVFLAAGGRLRATRCTFVDDVATWPKGGGALFVLGGRGRATSATLETSIVRGRESLHADPSKDYVVRIGHSIVPASTFPQPGFEELGANTLGVAPLVDVGDRLFRLVPGSPSGSIASARFPDVDLCGYPLGAPFRAPGASNALARAGTERGDRHG